VNRLLNPPLFIFIILFFPPHPAVHSQESKYCPGPWDLRLQLVLSKNSFSIYEPVILTYRVENTTKEFIQAAIGMSYSRGGIKLSIEHPDGQLVPEYSGIIACGPGPGLRMISPGKVFESQHTLFFNDMNGELAFPRTGKYKIHGEKWIRGPGSNSAKLESMTTEFEVIPPSDLDQQAIAFFDSKTDFLELMERGPWGYCRDRGRKFCHDQLTPFIKQFPLSSYTPYILFHWATYTKSQMWLEEFIEHYPENGYRAMAMTRLAGAPGIHYCNIEKTEFRYPGKSNLIEVRRKKIREWVKITETYSSRSGNSNESEEIPPSSCAHATAPLPLTKSKILPDFPQEYNGPPFSVPVYLLVSIGMDGIVKEAEVIRIHYPDWINFGIEARKAVKQWRFQPALLNGDPVEVKTVVKVENFQKRVQSPSP